MAHWQLLVPICFLIVLELNHLKWIWLTEWSCGRCGSKHKDCACSKPSWIKYL